jgi:hypothetical protein
VLSNGKPFVKQVSSLDVFSLIPQQTNMDLLPLTFSNPVPSMTLDNLARESASYVADYASDDAFEIKFNEVDVARSVDEAAD